MPKLNYFNGGISRVLDSHLIANNEGFSNSNVDHKAGSLKPMNERLPRVFNASKYGHRFTKNQQWYWSDTPADYVEFLETLYISYRTGRMVQIKNNLELNLGVSKPTGQPKLNAVSYTFSDVKDVTLTAIGALFSLSGNIPANTELEYRIINEPNPGQLSEGSQVFTITTGDSSVFTYFINIEIPCSCFTGDAHIYRRYNDEWRLVTTISYATTSTATDTVYDISANALLNEALLAEGGNVDGKPVEYAITHVRSIDNVESVPLLVNAKPVVENGQVHFTDLPVSVEPQVDTKRIYRLGGVLTAYTLIAEIPNEQTDYTDNIAALNAIGTLLTSQDHFPPPMNLKYIIEANAMLFGALNDRLYFTSIGEPDYWPQTYYLDFPKRITGLVEVPTGVLVFTQRETWLVTGTGPLSLAQQRISGSLGCVNHDTIAAVSGAAYWLSNDGICVSDGGSIVVWSREKVLGEEFVDSVNAVVHDEQYYLACKGTLTDDENSLLWIVDPKRNVLKNANWRIQSLFLSNNIIYGFDNGTLHELGGRDDVSLSFGFWSANFIGAGFTVPKVYKNFYVKSKGTVNVAIVIDGVQAQYITLATDDNHQIKIPSDRTRGFSVFFVLSGTGQVFEISWEEGNANG